MMKTDVSCFYRHAHNDMREGQESTLQDNEAGNAVQFYPIDPDSSDKIL